MTSSVALKAESTVNCMLLWPLHTHTSPNNTLLSVMVSPLLAAVTTYTWKLESGMMM